MKRALTREELLDLGIEPNRVEEILKKQRTKKERVYKFITKCTLAESEEVLKKTGVKLYRPKEYAEIYKRV